jgi:RNA polymerase sigma-70 factor (ECF subfamily)
LSFPLTSGNDQLDAELTRLHVAARAEWPELAIEYADFVRYVTERLPVGVDGVDAVTALRGLQTGQLYLACGCARGEPAAFKAFERMCAPVVALTLSQLRGLGGDADDVAQLVLQKVLVGDGDRSPKIVDYNGTGELRGWLKAVALRSGLNHLRKRKWEVVADEDDIWMAMPVGALAPGLAELRARCQSQFKLAFPRAVASLPPKERALLRYHYLDGLQLEQIGKIYNVHRSTASRWVESACSQLIEHLRGTLRDDLKVTEQELDSILQIIRSEIDLSLTGYFALAARRS